MADQFLRNFTVERYGFDVHAKIFSTTGDKFFQTISFDNVLQAQFCGEFLLEELRSLRGLVMLVRDNSLYSIGKKTVSDIVSRSMFKSYEKLEEMLNKQEEDNAS